MNSKYLDAKNNGASWSLSKQIEAFNKAKDDVNRLGNNLLNNLPDKLNISNPSYNSYNTWFKNASSKFKDIRTKGEILQNLIEDRKSQNKPLLDYMFYLPLQQMVDIAKGFNSFLNENPK